MACFEIRDLNFSYAATKEKKSLNDICLTVEDGEYTVICGCSGSGKTTLLRHLKTVLTPHGERSGEILFQNELLEKLGSREQTVRIGYVMQDPDDQIVTDKVWHELAFSLECLGVEREAMRRRVAEMASFFGIQDWLHWDVSRLSGGQKQLLNLASVMALQPQVLILDEPTSQLDPIASSDFLNTVRKINRELGTTVIITEHRLEDILPYADRVVVMDRGRIIADGAPAAVCKHLYEQEHPMFAAMPTPVQVYFACKAQGKCPLTVREGRKWLDENFDADICLDRSPAKENNEEAAVQLHDVWFRYEKDAPDVLRGMTLRVPRGSLFAIVGGNGVGKSTVLKTICGICKPYRGNVLIDGKPLRKYEAGKLFRKNLAMLPQDPKSLFVKKTVREELEEISHDPERIAKLAALCKITDLLQAHPYDLSGGEQQRAALAKVLLTDPKLLLLDEPTKGIDNFYKETLAGILRDLQQQGITVIMVSHDVEFCAKYADLVAMCFDGEMTSADAPSDFFGGNSFYTTAASRMSRGIFLNTVTVDAVVSRCRGKTEEIK